MDYVIKHINQKDCPKAACLYLGTIINLVTLSHVLLWCYTFVYKTKIVGSILFKHEYLAQKTLNKSLF